MTWLNWSLKFYIRLKTISILVPTHITQVYVQWMAYSFVWLYLIKCVSHAQFLLIKHKKIFLSVLVVFGKYFVFAKMSKISKTVLPYSGDLVAGKPSHMPPVVSLLSRFMQLSSGSRLQSQKRLRNFQKFWVFRFIMTQLATCSQVKGRIARGTQRFSWLNSRLPRG